MILAVRVTFGCEKCIPMVNNYSEMKTLKCKHCISGKGRVNLMSGVHEKTSVEIESKHEIISFTEPLEVNILFRDF